MNLAETYLDLYNTCRSFNDLVAEEREVENKFNDLDSYLRQHQREIEKYRLKPEIYRMFLNNQFNIDEIERLIQKKRTEAEIRRKRNMVLIKWSILILLIILLTLYKWWITIIIVVVIGILLIQFPLFRNKIGAMIAKDWKNLIGK